MYLANRVEETTTTTGTGNVTLAGATTGSKTFTSQYDLDVRFPYYIEASDDTWECGVGYLSGTTTLVREKVFDNSSGTLVALSLPTGTHTVYVAMQAMQSGHSTWGDIDTGTANDKLVRSAHVTGNLGASTGLSGAYDYWVPFHLNHAGYFDGIGCVVSTGAGTGSDEWHIGIYSRTDDGKPGERLEGSTTTALDFSTTGLKVHSFTKRFFPAGWYYMFVGGANGVSPSVVGGTGTVGGPNIGMDASSTTYADLFIGYYDWVNADTTTSPADGSAVITSDISKTMPQPWVLLRVVT